jgi:serine/threonine protein kinase
MRLSATRATNNSLHAFHRHVRQLWGMVDESTHAASKREARWVKQRSQQIELFVSEESKRWLVLNELRSAEQRIAFLSFMKSEMDVRGTNYTPGQLEVMKKACSDIARQLNSSEESSTTPKWFIPWYELRVDTWSCLGAGGFGSVYRAKWLDSDVVVKEVNLGGPGDQDSRFTSDESEQIVGSMTRETATTKRRRAAALEMFQHEVNIWFGFSHPHVVRLFGACHVGRPFFVCEYATKGTLVNYIRAHPDLVWKKLHEASLGVQYLHARGVIHGDLKGNNIMIGGDGKAKVTDFGLSLGIGGDNESSLQISGASQWLAPECLLGESRRPTIKADIYSLGMCIVEAMRVMEAAQREMDTRLFPSLPWGNLDNATVKVYVKNGELPIRPTVCTDKQWGLVERMCRFQPDMRVKISTVVDELAQLAAVHPVPLGQTTTRKPCQCPKKPANNAPQTSSEMVQGMRQRLERVRHDQGTASAHNLILGPIYDLLWDRIASVQHHTRGHHACEHADSMSEMLDTARASTEALQTVSSTLTQLTEATLGGYALHRRLDKFVDAVFLSLGEQDARITHDWKARCYELLGIPQASASIEASGPALDDTIAMKASWRCWCMS